MSEQRNPADDKPERLVYKSYLQMVRNAEGTELFRNFYVRRGDDEFDAVADGENFCAFFVSGVLTMWQKLDKGVHGTVAATEDDLEHTAGWRKTNEPALVDGDVLVWDAMTLDGDTSEHIGFYVGQGRAVSTSYKTHTVVEHDVHFGDTARGIKAVYHHDNW